MMDDISHHLQISECHFGFPATLPSPRVLTAMRAVESQNINCYGLHTRRALGEPQPDNESHPHRLREMEVIRRATHRIGLDGEPAGYVTSGATEGNLLSCFVAAQTARSVERYALVLTELAHSSVRKGLRFSGLLVEGPWVSRVSLPTGADGPPALEKYLATLAGSGVGAAGVFCTWGDPLTARTDYVHGIRLVIDHALMPCDLFVDAAFTGLFWPALGTGSLLGVRPSVLTLDLYKSVFGPVGVGLAFICRAAASRIVAQESYLPYGEERTILGSRNYTAVLAAETVLDLVDDGSIAKEYSGLRPRYERVLARLGTAVVDTWFPVVTFEVPRDRCSVAFMNALADFDLYGQQFREEFLRFRICLAPHQSETALNELLDLLCVNLRGDLTP